MGDVGSDRTACLNGITVMCHNALALLSREEPCLSRSVDSWLFPSLTHAHASNLTYVHS